MENENKLGNAGHVRVDWWDASNESGAEGALQIRLNHLPMEYIEGEMGGSKEYEMQLQTALGQMVLGYIPIENGRGDFDCTLEVLQEHLGKGITYEDIWSITIPLGGGHQIFCRLHEPCLVSEPDVPEQDEPREVTVSVEQEVPLSAAAQQKEADESAEPETREIPVKTPTDGTESVGMSQTPHGEDKWSHLCNIYPKIMPFSDSREYLKIGPNDFVVLHQKYYSLVHNSFMLHGYYQYGQLVLCRVLRRGKPLYYLGTPGLYLERDKQVALMYGFQSFECDSEPAMEGDFGYYMIQVEL